MAADSDCVPVIYTGFFVSSYIFSVSSPTELNTAQSLTEQVFSQSASLQRWPRKGEIFKDYSMSSCVIIN